MKLLPLTALAVLGMASIPAARAQQIGPHPSIGQGNTLLTVNAQGSSTRAPDLVLFAAGVTTQGKTANEALSENSTRMTQVIAALKRAGIADKDIQTSNLSINPRYAQPRRLPDGTYEPGEQQIVGYQANNTVSVRQRKLDDFGKVIDALVGAGANQVNGPNFTLSKPEAAQDEARAQAVKIARERANLYAQAAGLRVVRVVSINESGGGYAPEMMAATKRMSADAVGSAPPPPVAAGELETNINVTVQFELAP